MRRLLLVALATLFLIAALLPSQRSFRARAVSEGERSSMYCKPAVVRILTGPVGAFYYQPPNWKNGKTYTVQLIGTGSGFFINPNGYIATNAHVTQDHHDGEEKQKEALFRGLLYQVARDYNMDPRNLTSDNINFVAQHSRLTGFRSIHHVIIPDGSPFPYEIKSYGAPVGQGENWKDVSIIKIEVKNAPTLLFGDSDNMKLQDPVIVIGYPGAADSEEPNTLDRKSQLEASITDGKISARKSTEGGAPVLQISASTTHGNSGGPVLNDAMEVIGLLTFRGNTVFGQEVQGFNFVVASNTAKEFLGGVSNELGPADKAYRDGLELYWNQEYKNAISKFEEVKRLFPQHSEIDRLVQSSQQSITEGKDRSGISGWWFAAGGLVLLLLIVAIIVIAAVIFFVMRRRRKAHPLPTAPAAPLPSRPAYSPTPSNSPTPALSNASAPSPTPRVAPAAAPDQVMTVDLAQTVALHPDTAPISYGCIKFVSGVLAGQKFDVMPAGSSIGRDASLAQIVLPDPRISKQHVWIGVKDGRVVITDQGSRNGTFVNNPKSARVTETVLNDKDTVILGESDVARFEYQK